LNLLNNSKINACDVYAWFQMIYAKKYTVFLGNSGPLWSFPAKQRAIKLKTFCSKFVFLKPHWHDCVKSNLNGPTKYTQNQIFNCWIKLKDRLKKFTGRLGSKKVVFHFRALLSNLSPPARAWKKGANDGRHAHIHYSSSSRFGAIQVFFKVSAITLI